MAVATVTKSAVTTYAKDVLAGKIIAGELVRAACARHLRDLDEGAARGLRFDAAAAARAIAFYEFCPQTKGEWAGQPLRLLPWQAFVIGSIFGWKRADGSRRFRTAYTEVPRKNGKSTLAAPLALLLAFFDGEPGADVYSAATKRDQAKIVWSEAKAMIERSPKLRERIEVLAGNLSRPAERQKFEPLSSDYGTLDGLNIHGAIVDELHAWKERLLWDVIETARGARRQPLTFVITTAGFDRRSVCWEQHEYAIQVVQGVIEDDSVFGFIATIDDGDDWTDPRSWAKANPSLGVSVKLDYLAEECRKAQAIPGKQNAFRRLHLNVWTESANRWLDLRAWDAQALAATWDELEGRSCYVGVDMSSTTDLTAVVLWFPDPSGNGGDVISRFFCPEDSILQRSQEDRVPYSLWAEQGWIEPTEGNVVDYDVVRARINELGERYHIEEIAIDRWNSTQLQTQLIGDGFTVVPFGQGFASMSGPAKEFERLVLGGQLRHGGNPILRWMGTNVVRSEDAAGNIKPDKGKSAERIDGIVALIMAIGRASVSEPPQESIYEQEDHSLWL